MPIYDVEEEVHIGRRAFAEAQAQFRGPALTRLPGLIAVGWYDGDVEPEAGSFCVVRTGGPFDDDSIIGEVLAFTYEQRPTVYAYCLGSREVADDIALYRRAFLAVRNLAMETADCVVEVVV
jgi:hypothetical protein